MDPAGQRLDEHHVQRRVVEGVPDAMGVAVADGGQCGKAVAVDDPLQAAAGIGFADAGPDGEPLAGALARAGAGGHVDLRVAAVDVFEAELSGGGLQHVDTDVVPAGVADHLVEGALAGGVAAVGAAGVGMHEHGGPVLRGQVGQPVGHSLHVAFIEIDEFGRALRLADGLTQCLQAGHRVFQRLHEEVHHQHRDTGGGEALHHQRFLDALPIGAAGKACRQHDEIRPQRQRLFHREAVGGVPSHQGHLGNAREALQVGLILAREGGLELVRPAGQEGDRIGREQRHDRHVPRLGQDHPLGGGLQRHLAPQHVGDGDGAALGSCLGRRWLRARCVGCQKGNGLEQQCCHRQCRGGRQGAANRALPCPRARHGGGSCGTVAGFRGGVKAGKQGSHV